MPSPPVNVVRLAIFSVLLVAFAAMAAERVRFTPKFSTGEVLRYQVESSSRSTGKTTTPIANPEGGSRSSQAIHMLVRLDVIDAAPAGKVRFRATYEKSSAESESDALDLAASSLADLYGHLENHSFEFTLVPGTGFAEVQNSDASPSGPATNEPILSWINGLASGEGIPQKGVAIGDKWKTERPLPRAVLSGLIWRAESSYLRNEPCPLPPGSRTASVTPKTPAEDCAVILTHFEILRRGAKNSDATPDDYRRNGLRTSGTWTGSGESFDSISRATGLLMSSTQTSTQEMNYQITSATSGSTIHHVGKVQSQSEITLVPDHP